MNSLDSSVAGSSLHLLASPCQTSLLGLPAPRRISEANANMVHSVTSTTTPRSGGSTGAAPAIEIEHPSVMDTDSLVFGVRVVAGSVPVSTSSSTYHTPDVSPSAAITPSEKVLTQDVPSEFRGVPLSDYMSSELQPMPTEQHQPQMAMTNFVFPTTANESAVLSSPSDAAAPNLASSPPGSVRGSFDAVAPSHAAVTPIAAGHHLSIPGVPGPQRFRRISSQSSGGGGLTTRNNSYGGSADDGVPSGAHSPSSLSRASKSPRHGETGSVYLTSSFTKRGSLSHSDGLLTPLAGGHHLEVRTASLLNLMMVPIPTDIGEESLLDLLRMPSTPQVHGAFDAQTECSVTTTSEASSISAPRKWSASATMAPPTGVVVAPHGQSPTKPVAPNSLAAVPSPNHSSDGIGASPLLSHVGRLSGTGNSLSPGSALLLQAPQQHRLSSSDASLGGSTTSSQPTGVHPQPTPSSYLTFSGPAGVDGHLEAPTVGAPPTSLVDEELETDRSVIRLTNFFLEEVSSRLSIVLSFLDGIAPLAVHHFEMLWRDQRSGLREVAHRHERHCPMSTEFAFGSSPSEENSPSSSATSTTTTTTTLCSCPCSYAITEATRWAFTTAEHSASDYFHAYDAIMFRPLEQDPKSFPSQYSQPEGGEVGDDKQLPPCLQTVFPFDDDSWISVVGTVRIGTLVLTTRAFYYAVHVTLLSSFTIASPLGAAGAVPPPPPSAAAAAQQQPQWSLQHSSNGSGHRLSQQVSHASSPTRIGGIAKALGSPIAVVVGATTAATIVSSQTGENGSPSIPSLVTQQAQIQAPQPREIIASMWRTSLLEAFIFLLPDAFFPDVALAASMSVAAALQNSTIHRVPPGLGGFSSRWSIPRPSLIQRRESETISGLWAHTNRSGEYFPSATRREEEGSLSDGVAHLSSNVGDVQAAPSWQDMLKVVVETEELARCSIENLLLDFLQYSKGERMEMDNVASPLSFSGSCSDFLQRSRRPTISSGIESIAAPLGDSNHQEEREEDSSSYVASALLRYRKKSVTRGGTSRTDDASPSFFTLTMLFEDIRNEDCEEEVAVSSSFGNSMNPSSQAAILRSLSGGDLYTPSSRFSLPAPHQSIAQLAQLIMLRSQSTSSLASTPRYESSPPPIMDDTSSMTMLSSVRITALLETFSMSNMKPPRSSNLRAGGGAASTSDSIASNNTSQLAVAVVVATAATQTDTQQEDKQSSSSAERPTAPEQLKTSEVVAVASQGTQTDPPPPSKPGGISSEHDTTPLPNPTPLRFTPQPPNRQVKGGLAAASLPADVADNSVARNASIRAAAILDDEAMTKSSGRVVPLSTGTPVMSINDKTHGSMIHGSSACVTPVRPSAVKLSFLNSFQQQRGVLAASSSPSSTTRLGALFLDDALASLSDQSSSDHQTVKKVDIHEVTAQILKSVQSDSDANRRAAVSSEDFVSAIFRLRRRLIVDLAQDENSERSRIFDAELQGRRHLRTALVGGPLALCELNVYTFLHGEYWDDDVSEEASQRVLIENLESEARYLELHFSHQMIGSVLREEERTRCNILDEQNQFFVKWVGHFEVLFNISLQDALLGSTAAALVEDDDDDNDAEEASETGVVVEQEQHAPIIIMVDTGAAPHAPSIAEVAERERLQREELLELLSDCDRSFDVLIAEYVHDTEELHVWNQRSFLHHVRCEQRRLREQVMQSRIAELGEAESDSRVSMISQWRNSIKSLHRRSSAAEHSLGSASALLLHPQPNPSSSEDVEEENNETIVSLTLHDEVLDRQCILATEAFQRVSLCNRLKYALLCADLSREIQALEGEESLSREVIASQIRSCMDNGAMVTFSSSVLSQPTPPRHSRRSSNSRSSNSNLSLHSQQQQPPLSSFLPRLSLNGYDGITTVESRRSSADSRRPSALVGQRDAFEGSSMAPDRDGNPVVAGEAAALSSLQHQTTSLQPLSAPVCASNNTPVSPASPHTTGPSAPWTSTPPNSFARLPVALSSLAGGATRIPFEEAAFFLQLDVQRVKRSIYDNLCRKIRQQHQHGGGVPTPSIGSSLRSILASLVASRLDDGSVFLHTAQSESAASSNNTAGADVTADGMRQCTEGIHVYRHPGRSTVSLDVLNGLHGDVYVGQMGRGLREGEGMYEYIGTAIAGLGEDEDLAALCSPRSRHGIGLAPDGETIRVFSDVYVGHWHRGLRHGVGFYVQTSHQVAEPAEPTMTLVFGDWVDGKLASVRWMSSAPLEYVSVLAM